MAKVRLEAARHNAEYLPVGGMDINHWYAVAHLNDADEFGSYDAAGPTPIDALYGLTLKLAEALGDPDA